MSPLGIAVLAAPAPSPARIPAVAAVLAWVLAVPLFFAGRWTGVVAHEGGHAIVAKLLFQGIKSITFTGDGGGATEYRSPVPWPLSILTAAAGYLGPSMYGLLGAWLLHRGEVDAVLWGSLAFLFVMLIVVRGPIGLLLVPGLMVVLYLVAARTHEPLRSLYAYLWVWLLLIVAVEHMFFFMRNQFYDEPTSDTAKIGARTLLPSALWAVVLLVGTLAALVLGGRLLLLPS